MNEQEREDEVLGRRKLIALKAACDNLRSAVTPPKTLEFPQGHRHGDVKGICHCDYPMGTMTRLEIELRKEDAG